MVEFSNWFVAISSDAWAAIIGALLGSIVGGVISFSIQKSVMKETKKERAAERLNQKKTLAHVLIVKAIRLQSNLYQLHLHMEECLALDKSSRPSLVMKSLANLPDRLYFSDEELALVLSLGDDNVSNTIVLIDHVHNSKLDAFKKMIRLRSELQELLPPAQNFDETGRSEIKLDHKQSVQLEPRFIVLDNLIMDVREGLGDDYYEAEQLTSDLVKAINKSLGMKLKLKTNTDLSEKLNSLSSKSQFP
ncbi:MAG: hypothetical protein ABJO86_17000 [Lentilitoribacter sp.]